MGNGNGAKPDGYRSGAELRAMREQGVWQTLLSGTPVRMRIVTPDMLLAGGSMPDILSPLVTKMIFEYVEGFELDGFIAQREEAKHALEVVKSLNLVCKAALLEPRIVDTPQADDEICAEDLTLADRGWIFKLAFQSAEFLKTFRNEPARDVEAAPDSEGDVQPTEQDDVREGQAGSIPA